MKILDLRVCGGLKILSLRFHAVTFYETSTSMRVIRGTVVNVKF
jgi:hypothetical protein